MRLKAFEFRVISVRVGVIVFFGRKRLLFLTQANKSKDYFLLCTIADTSSRVCIARCATFALVNQCTLIILLIVERQIFSVYIFE